jgi:N-acetylmuramoyl-L-alanine amidase
VTTRPHQPKKPSKPAARSPGLSRRALVQGAGWLALWLGPAQLARGATILAVRIWPAADYSRVTIESDGALVARKVFVAEPPRLAVDIEGIDLTPPLRELVAKVRSDDPNIAGIRVGQQHPGTVRLVLDLKQAIEPQVFNLAPVAAYQHRLVLDLYPTRGPDPLQTLIRERDRDVSSAAPMSGRSPGAPAPAARAADPLGDLMAERSRSAGTAPAPAAPPSAEGASTGQSASTNAPAAASGAAVAPSASTGRMDRFIVVALDPGHGGEDPGAIGPAGTREKDIVLAIAFKLRERINAATVQTAQGRYPMRAFLTRDADFFVPLMQRVHKARRVQADLFLSVHADAFYNPEARGASVFALSEGAASSNAARWMAQRENSADNVGGLNVSNTRDGAVQRALLDMSTTAQINDSLRLGSSVLGEIGRFARLHKPRVEQAGFAVLRAPDIPSVLVETAFISNPGEEQRLRDPEYQDALADALLRGIQRYFSRNPPLARARQA